MSDHDEAHEEARDLEGPTPGAQRQLDAMRARMHKALVAMIIVCGLFGIGFVATGWQIGKAFDTLEEERISRIGGQSSINAYFCRKIDEVGDGVAALVAVSLREVPDEASLTSAQLAGLRDFRAYLNRQARPPRCRAVALQLAVLTGADPADVVITPLHLDKPSASDRKK
jgi:hypothetical protein